MMPQTWRATYHSNREYVTELRRTAERRRDIEDRYPELAGDRRPVLAPRRQVRGDTAAGRRRPGAGHPAH